MKKKIKKFYQEYSSFIDGFLATLGFISLLDWVIAPGLTAANTYLNLFSVVLLIGFVFLFVVVLWKPKQDEVSEEILKKEDNDGDDPKDFPYDNNLKE